MNQPLNTPIPASGAEPATLNRILCVDDEADILDVAQMCLETVGGFEVMTCTSGAEALLQAETFMPDVILLDVMMPDMNGPQTLQALRKKSALKLVPVIFMTARAQPAEIKSYIKLGALAVITKPFDPMQLSSEVKQLWELLRE